MAVNTRDKRSCAVNLASPWRGMLPQPGTLTVGDRHQVAFMYRGLADDGGVVSAARQGNGQMLHMAKWMNR